MSINNILSFDLETSTFYENVDVFKKEDPNHYFSFKTLFDKQQEYDNENDFYLSKMPLYPEYNRIVCCGFSYFGDDGLLKSKSVGTLDDEKKVISDTVDILNKFLDKDFKFIGWNIIGFDMPLIIKKCIKYNIHIDKRFINEMIHVKPWEKNLLIDLMKVWSIGNNYSNSALTSVTTFFGHSSSKDGEINGKNTPKVYWGNLDNIEKRKENLDKIKDYSIKDTESVLFLYKDLLPLL